MKDLVHYTAVVIVIAALLAVASQAAPKVADLLTGKLADAVNVK